MKNSLMDLPVLMIFFTRTDTLEKVFEKVKEARPSKLFLACDGAREGNLRDVDAIEKCKKIVEDIDWECEVYKHYSEVNLGCGKGPQAAISWAFEHVDRLVILEDDCVPHSSFFKYMECLLEKYKNDTRIGVISGFNHFEKWDSGGYSYFYTKVGPLAGAWATWKRVWEDYSYDLPMIENDFIASLLVEEITHKRAKKKKLKAWKDVAKKIKNSEKLSYWDVQFAFLKFYKSYLSIVPKFSLVSNIGLGNGATHAVNASNIMPSIFYTKEKILEFPLEHPPFIICDRKYDNAVDEKWGYPKPIIKFSGRIVRFLKRILRFRKNARN